MFRQIKLLMKINQMTKPIPLNSVALSSLVPNVNVSHKSIGESVQTLSNGANLRKSSMTSNNSVGTSSHQNQTPEFHLRAILEKLHEKSKSTETIQCFQIDKKEETNLMTFYSDFDSISRILSILNFVDLVYHKKALERILKNESCERMLKVCDFLLELVDLIKYQMGERLFQQVFQFIQLTLTTVNSQHMTDTSLDKVQNLIRRIDEILERYLLKSDIVSSLSMIEKTKMKSSNSMKIEKLHF